MSNIFKTIIIIVGMISFGIAEYYNTQGQFNALSLDSYGCWRIYGDVGFVVSVVSVAMVLYRQVLWRLDWGRGYPILRKKYDGTVLYSESDGSERSIPVEILVNQKMNKIAIILSSNASSSKTINGCFVSEGETPSLCYVYRLTPRQGQPSSYGEKLGAAKIEKIGGNDGWQGPYWTSDGRCGTLYFYITQELKEALHRNKVEALRDEYKVGSSRSAWRKMWNN